MGGLWQKQAATGLIGHEWRRSAGDRARGKENPRGTSAAGDSYMRPYGPGHSQHKET